MATEKTETRAPFFVMAHHRSGSNFLNDLLQAHPALECVNEPFSMHTAFFRECDLEPWLAQDFDPDCLHRTLAPHEGLRAYLLEMRQHLQQSCASRVVGFKETALFGKLEWLQAFIPGIKVVFLRRDPRAIVSSVLRSGLTDFWHYARLVPPAFAQLCPQYQSSAGDDEACAAEIAAMSVVVRYELAERELPACAHRTIDLDEFMREPAESLNALTAFLGVHPDAEQVSFLLKRQIVSRGGAFSSFRSPADVKNTWRGHLSVRQVEAIESVLTAIRERHDGQGLTEVC
jgi:hypothetical protein